MNKFSCIIVDDDKWALADIRNSVNFADANFQIIGEYMNANDAMVAIENNSPTLVITDICMGMKSGLDLIHDCRERGLPVEFIVMSGYSDFSYAKNALNYNVFYYMLKPINAQEGTRVLKRLYEHLLHGQVYCDSNNKCAFDNAIQYVRDNYSENITLSKLADKFGYNSNYLSELFKQKTGKSYVQFRNEVRIEKAKIMLRSSSLPITDIANKCGFCDASYFTVVFKQISGKSPTFYRK